MKKLLLVLAIGSFAACNSAASTDTKTDSVVVKTDSVTTVITDSTKVDSAAKKLIDSVKK